MLAVFVIAFIILLPIRKYSLDLYSTLKWIPQLIYIYLIYNEYNRKDLKQMVNEKLIGQYGEDKKRRKDASEKSEGKFVELEPGSKEFEELEETAEAEEDSKNYPYIIKGKKVYYHTPDGSYLIKNADSKTFKVLEDYLARDKKHVYYMMESREGVDIKTFKKVGKSSIDTESSYYKDKSGIYLYKFLDNDPYQYHKTQFKKLKVNKKSFSIKEHEKDKKVINDFENPPEFQ
jgi:hypothetical protein